MIYYIMLHLRYELEDGSYVYARCEYESDHLLSEKEYLQIRKSSHDSIEKSYERKVKECCMLSKEVFDKESMIP